MSVVLVTGGAGFVGSHVAKALAAAGMTPVVYDDLSRGVIAAVKYGPFEQGDVGDRARLVEVMHKYHVDAVVHLAGLAYVHESIARPLRYYLINTVGTAVLLQAMQECGLSRVVLSGSCSVYADDPDNKPLSERSALAPGSPYAESKLKMERIAEDAGAAHKIKWLSLRYFNATGADPDGELSERDPGMSRVIPNLLRAAAAGADSFPVNGTDYATADGTCVRDYVHVADLAAAHVAALKYLGEGGSRTRINLGTGQGHSIRALIDAAQRVTGRDIPVRSVARRAGDAAVRVADASLARQELKWQPRYTDLDQLIAHAWTSRDWSRD